MADPDLIDQLDPSRDYGPRSYEQVVEAVREGSLVLEPGDRLPIIKDANTHLTVKGTGRPAGRGGNAAFSRAYIQEQFANNAEAIWTAIMVGIGEGDPRWAKLALEYGIGAPLQDKGNESASSEMLKVLAALASRQMAAPMATEEPTGYIEAPYTREV